MASKKPSDGTRPDLSLRRRVFSPPTLISFVLAALVLGFMVTRFEVDLGAIWSNIQSANPFLFVFAIIVHYLTFLFRGARWRLFLRNAARHSGNEQQTFPSVVKSARLVLLGWFVNSVSWFRLGDAYRAYTYSEDTNTSFAHTAGTVLAERVVDIVMVFGLLVVAIVLMVVNSEITPSFTFIWTALGMVITAGVILIGMRLFRARLSHRLPAPLASAYHRLHTGTTGSFSQLRLVFLLGLLGWLCEFARLYLVSQALGLPLGVGLVLFAMLASALLTTIPLTPGGLGLVETGLTGLLMIALPREVAMSIAVLDRSISYLSIIVVGGAIFTLHHMSLVRRRRMVKNPPASSNAESS